MSRTIVLALAAAALAAVTAACSSVASQITQVGGSSPSSAATGSASAARSAASPDSGAPLRLLTEPADGLGPLYQLITGARSSVDLTMYELADSAAEADLAADAARGVTVRVLLDQHLEQSRNQDAYSYLTAHHVQVHWAPADTTYHQKTLTVDNAASAVMSLNLVTDDYPSTRDFAVIDTTAADVAAIVATFNADFAGQPAIPPGGRDLVWSPTTAESAILSVIGQATRTLAVEAEEMDDPAITAALASAARRGVTVTVTMTDDPRWHPAFAQLTQAGAHVRIYPDQTGTLYIHAKALLADAGRATAEALIGSQNFSAASLNHNRELGILTRDQSLVASAGATLAADYAHAQPYGTSTQGSASTPGAWCTATATVYNAIHHENDVSVHSNQPNQSATASGGGYSRSYQTNSSGDAVIYLNGPLPGTRITVRVGAATCTTSD